MTACTASLPFFFQEWLTAANGFGNKDLTSVQPTIKAKSFFRQKNLKAASVSQLPPGHNALHKAAYGGHAALCSWLQEWPRDRFKLWECSDSILIMLEKSDTCFVIWFARIMLLWILIRRM